MLLEFVIAGLILPGSHIFFRNLVLGTCPEGRKRKEEGQCRERIELLRFVQFLKMDVTKLHFEFMTKPQTGKGCTRLLFMVKKLLLRSVFLIFFQIRKPHATFMLYVFVATATRIFTLN